MATQRLHIRQKYYKPLSAKSRDPVYVGMLMFVFMLPVILLELYGTIGGFRDGEHLPWIETGGSDAGYHAEGGSQPRFRGGDSGG